MNQHPLTDRQREALLILFRSPEGVDRSRCVTQGVWNSLRKRDLTIYRRPFDRLTDKGRSVAESLAAAPDAASPCPACGGPTLAPDPARPEERGHYCEQCGRPYNLATGEEML